MPSLWDKLRGSRRKVKIRSKSVNDSADEDEFLASIKKRESFIETTQTDWVEVPAPKTQSLGRGMRLEPDKKAKSATLDGGFNFKRKSDWKPKVTDIEEVKGKSKKKDGEKKTEKKETKFDKKKDKRKSREIDFENAQLERGESFIVGRKMVLWRGDRKRDSQFDMEPVSTVDQWAACARASTSGAAGGGGGPGSMTPGSTGSLSVHSPGSLPPSLGSLTTPSPVQELGPLVESPHEDSGVAHRPSSQCFHHDDNQGPVITGRRDAAAVARRPVSFHQTDTDVARRPQGESQRLGSPGHILKPPEGPVLKSPRKLTPKKKSQSKDSLQSPTFESRVPVAKGASSPQPESGPMLTSPPSKIPKLRRSQSNKQNGAATPTSTTPTSPVPAEGPILTPPPRSMAQQSQEKPRTNNNTQDLTSESVAAGDEIDDTVDCSVPDSVPGAVKPDLSENEQVDLHKSLNHNEQSLAEATPGDRAKSAKLVLTELLERAAPPAKSTDDLTDIDEVAESLMNGSSDRTPDSIYSHKAECSESELAPTRLEATETMVPCRNSVEISVFVMSDSSKIGSLMTGEMQAEPALTEATTTNDQLAPQKASVDENKCTETNNEMATTINGLASIDQTSPSSTDRTAVTKPDVDDIMFTQLEVVASMNGNCEISPNGAGDTLANTTADELYITSTKYFDQNTEENIFELEMQEGEMESKDDVVVDLQSDFDQMKKSMEPVEIQIQIPEKAMPPKHLRNFELPSPQSPCRPIKPICLVAYPRRLVNLSPCERCSRSIDSVLSGLDDMDSPILEQDVHDWVLVDKDFESPKMTKRTLDKKVQTDFQMPIDIKKPRVCSSNSSSLAEMRASIERNSCTLEDMDSLGFDDYVVPTQLLRPTDAHYRISGQCSDEFELFGQISPLGQFASSPLEEEPKKPAAKPPVSQIKGHQPDLVSNSIGSRAHAAQEISRLEALCEARTKELTFAKMQIKSASQGFDAMSVIVQYLSHEMNAFQSPELNKRLINAETKITRLLSDIDDLRGEKSRIETTLHDLIQSHKEATEAMRADHRAQLTGVEERVAKKHEDELQKVIDQHTEEVKTLKAYHEKRSKEQHERQAAMMEEIEREHERSVAHLGRRHERYLDELQKQHEIKLEEITKRFEEIKCTLHDKVYTLKAECDELRNRSAMYEEALQRDTNFQVQKKSDDRDVAESPKPRAYSLRQGTPTRGPRGTPERRPVSWSCHDDGTTAAYLDCLESLKQFDKELALAPYRDLPQEIDSLRTVVEMRNAEIHELRQSKAEMERQLEELPNAREKIISLEQKIENLEAIVTMKQDYEKQLVEKHQMLLRRYDKESKANKRLSMDNEELMYRLNETEDLLLSPSPERTGASPVTTPDILARRGFCRSPHDSALVTRRVRTSSTSSSDDKRSSTISMRSEDEKAA